LRCVADGRAFSVVPGRRGRGEHLLEDALEALRRALSPRGIPWMVIGGLAVIARGVRRWTTDIDAVVEGDAIEIPALLQQLAKQRIVPRIPNAKAFAQTNLILLVQHEPSGVELDVSLGWTGFEREALAARSDVTFGPVTVPMALPEDLVIFKVLAARARDIDDATALIALYPSMDLTRVRRSVAKLAQLIDEPQRVQILEKLLKDARGASRRGGSSKARRRTKRSPTSRSTRTKRKR